MDFPKNQDFLWDHSALASTAMQEVHVTNKYVGHLST